jgi:hypothetical protein
MAKFGGKDRSDAPGGQGSDTAGGKAGAGPAASHDSGGSYSVGKDRNSTAGAQAVAALAARQRLNATPTIVPGGASGTYNSASALAARSPITAGAVTAQNDYNRANRGLGAGLLDRIAGIAPMDPTSRLQGNLRTGTIPTAGVHYGVDAIGAGAGLVGAATGIPLGTGYSALRDFAQRAGLVGQNFGRVDLGSGGPNARVAEGGHPARGGGADQGGGLGPGGNRNPIPQPRTPRTQQPTPTPTPVAPTPTAPPPPTWADQVAAYMPKLRSDFDWNMQQRGLGANTKDISGNAINWDDVFNQELAHRQAGIPVGATTGTDQSAFDNTANQYLLSNFGAGALDDYQTRQRALGRANVGGQGLENEFNTRFGQDDVQGYLNDVYNTQFGQAKKIIDNVNARGEFNPFGYNAALQDLGRQGTAGRSTLNDLAGSYLTTAKGTLSDALSGIYDKIGSYTLGSGYNPTSDISDLRSKENTLAGGLQGQILGSAPNIFDTSSTMQRASSQQGATSGGSLTDTLAQRSLNTGNRSRGLRSTGAF